jgi:hypothetical protein
VVLFLLFHFFQKRPQDSFGGPWCHDFGGVDDGESGDFYGATSVFSGVITDRDGRNELLGLWRQLWHR